MILSMIALQYSGGSAPSSIAKYAAMIERIEGEERAETERRLSKAINEKIDSTIFHKAVSRVRKS